MLATQNPTYASAPCYAIPTPVATEFLPFNVTYAWHEKIYVDDTFTFYEEDGDWVERDFATGEEALAFANRVLKRMLATERFITLEYMSVVEYDRQGDLVEVYVSHDPHGIDSPRYRH